MYAQCMLSGRYIFVSCFLNSMSNVLARIAFGSELKSVGDAVEKARASKLDLFEWVIQRWRVLD